MKSFADKPLQDGYQRKYAKAVLSGPTLYGGLDIRELMDHPRQWTQPANSQLSAQRRRGRRDVTNGDSVTAGAGWNIVACP